MLSEKIRLSEKEIDQIQQAFLLTFKSGDHLWVFGSRADMTKKGGDIDLFVESQMDASHILDAKFNFMRELFLRFDDRKIDIVVQYKGAISLPIYAHAKETGVQIL